MDKIFDFFYSTVEKEDYSKAMEIGVVILILFAPSISIIFLYKRELFIATEFSKLLLIGIVINVIFLIITYSMLKVVTSFEQQYNFLEYYAIGKEINEVKKELENSDASEVEGLELLKERIEKNLKRYSSLPEPLKQHNIKVIRKSKEYISLFTIIVWVLYIWDYFDNQNVSSDFPIKRLLLYIGFAVIMGLFKMIFSIIKYSKEIKKPYKVVTGKEYKLIKDKTFWLSLITILLFGICFYIFLKV